MSHQVSSAPSATRAVASEKKSSLSMLTFAIMIITAVVSLRGLPSQAEFGFQSIFYYLLAGIIFLIPFSLVCAELGSTFTKSGGVFRWSGEAFGPLWGFVTIFLEWATIIIWLPSVLIFSSSALAYVFWPETFDQHLAANRWYTIAVVLVVYWAATLNSFRGLKASATVAKWGGIIGTLIPAALLVILAVVWMVRGEKIELPLHSGFFPDFSKVGNVVLAASIFLFFAGVEMNFVHVGNLKNPKKDVPRAVMIAAVVIIAIFIVCTLAIGVVLPEKDINLTQSLLVAFNTMWESLHLKWMGNVMALAITIGVIGQVAVIIAGPSAGIFAVGRAGYLPPRLQKANKNGVQVPIILVQSAVVTLMSLVLVIVPSVETAYQILSQLATITYLLMAALVFIAFVHLRKKYPVKLVPRGFKIPGGEGVAWFIGAVGVIGVAAAFFISFFPPSQIPTGSPWVYIGILIAGTIIVAAIPFIIMKAKKPAWDEGKAHFAPFGQYLNDQSSGRTWLDKDEGEYATEHANTNPSTSSGSHKSETANPTTDTAATTTKAVTPKQPTSSSTQAAQTPVPASANDATPSTHEAVVAAQQAAQAAALAAEDAALAVAAEAAAEAAQAAAKAADAVPATEESLHHLHETEETGEDQ